MGPDEHAVSAGLAYRLDDKLGEIRQNMIAVSFLIAKVGGHVF